ncbi:MAG: histidine kinase dimerization/phospho-acceptor domain-containing protein, partial [Bacteroidota bacterium]
IIVTAGSVNVFFTHGTMGLASGEHLAFIVVVFLAFLVIDINKDPWLLWGLIFFSFVVLVVCLVLPDAWLSGQAMEGEKALSAYLGNFITTLIAGTLFAYVFQNLSGKQVKQIKNDARKQLQAVFDNVYDAIFVVSPQDRYILETNLRALELFSMQKKEQFLGQKFDLLLKEDSENTSFELALGEQFETEYLTADNRKFWGSTAITLLENDGSTQWLIRITDITEKKAAEAALVRAKETAESANLAKSYFLANMSHEIRTPINGILGLTDIIQTEVDDPEIKYYTDLIIESGNRLLRTMGAVLDLSRLESGVYDLDPKPILINQALDKAITQFGEEAEEKGLNLSISPNATPEYGLIDMEWLAMVLDHMVGNAIKFTKEGSVTLNCGKGGTIEAPIVWLEVVDTGIGMSEEFINGK